jgi:hypothetical protein
MKVSAVRIASAVLFAFVSITANAQPVDVASVSLTAGVTGQAIQHIAGDVSHRDLVAAANTTFVNLGVHSTAPSGADLQVQFNR